jgi:hypothetical protein
VTQFREVAGDLEDAFLSVTRSEDQAADSQEAGAKDEAKTDGVLRPAFRSESDSEDESE